jgi:hypothetical protein
LQTVQVQPMNPGGKCRLNAILYRIALTQARYAPEARA